MMACKPQTLEHIAIIDLLGIRRGIVALTKADIASPERIAAVEKGDQDGAERHVHRRDRHLAGLGADGAGHGCAEGAAFRCGARHRRPFRRGRLQARDRSLLHAYRNRRRRHGDRAFGCGARRRSYRRQPVRPDRTRARPACAEPRRRRRPRRRTLRAQSRGRRHHQRRHPSRRCGARSCASRADRSHRCEAASAARREEARGPVVSRPPASCGGRSGRAHRASR